MRLRLLIVLLTLLAIVIVGCGGEQPTPSPPREAAPPDEPKLSENEVCSYIWSRIEFELPEKYNKKQFLINTRRAEYLSNGEWVFSVFGATENITVLQPEVYMDFETSGNQTQKVWFEEQKRKVESSRLKLTATFYEKVNIIDALNVEEFDKCIDIETISKTRLKGQLLVQWINAYYSGYQYHTEGSVENVGKIPLTGVQIEVKNYDPDGNLIKTQVIPLYPETIAPGELGLFYDRVYLKGMTLRTYTYRFISDSGEEISYSKENKQKS